MVLEQKRAAFLRSAKCGRRMGWLYSLPCGIPAADASHAWIFIRNELRPQFGGSFVLEAARPHGRSCPRKSPAPHSGWPNQATLQPVDRHQRCRPAARKPTPSAFPRPTSHRQGPEQVGEPGIRCHHHDGVKRQHPFHRALPCQSRPYTRAIVSSRSPPPRGDCR